MQFDVHGHAAYCHSGGDTLDPARPTIVFIHGALNDHSVWGALPRWFADQGWNALAPGLPAHGRSEGPALATIGDMADWLLALLDAAGIGQAMLVGHSMGSLVALEAAARAPQRAAGLALLGTAFPMKVSGKLLAMARDDEAAAIDLVTQWSHSSPLQETAGRPPDTWPPAATRRLMHHVARRGPPGLFHTDFVACNGYANGLAAAAAVACPALLIAGTRDAMTPPRAAQALADAIAGARMIELDAGHVLMAEQPDAVRDALADFARAARSATLQGQ